MAEGMTEEKAWAKLQEARDRHRQAIEARTAAEAAEEAAYAAWTEAWNRYKQMCE